MRIGVSFGMTSFLTNHQAEHTLTSEKTEERAAVGRKLLLSLPTEN
jgi:hypothetical protein